MATLTFLEQTDPIEPAGMGCTIEGAKKVAIYALEDPTQTDLQNALTTILGDTSTEVGDGRLQRTPPLAHPIYPWLYASAISDIRGRGAYTLQDAPGGDELEVPPLPQFALYQDYVFTVEFTPRPYPIVLDQDIVQGTGTWYNESGSGIGYQTAPEWQRYTDYEVTPRQDTDTAMQGQMVFQSSGGADNVIFPGMPKMYLPNSSLKVTWYQVPYRYYTSANSYFERFKGYINQVAWWGFGAGALLFLGANPIKYTPPVPELDPLFGVFSTQKLCNLELMFLLTRRTASDLPAAPSNQNYIMAGWNLLPWFTDRNFHFAMSAPAAGFGSATPSWLSYPPEILFRDPDAGGGV